MKSQFDLLVRGAKFLKQEKEWYKKASETKSDNLHMAEKEVACLLNSKCKLICSYLRYDHENKYSERFRKVGKKGGSLGYFQFL